MKSAEKCEIGHAHSENNLRVAGELGRDVPPKLCKDRVGRTALSNDLHTTSTMSLKADETPDSRRTCPLKRA